MLVGACPSRCCAPVLQGSSQLCPLTHLRPTTCITRAPSSLASLLTPFRTMRRTRTGCDTHAPSFQHFLTCHTRSVACLTRSAACLTRSLIHRTRMGRGCAGCVSTAGAGCRRLRRARRHAAASRARAAQVRGCPLVLPGLCGQRVCLHPCQGPPPPLPLPRLSDSPRALCRCPPSAGTLGLAGPPGVDTSQHTTIPPLTQEGHLPLLIQVRGLRSHGLA